jgi:hypothetical protein
MNLKKIVHDVLIEQWNKNYPPIKITDEIYNEVIHFNTSEELLRSGGISIEALDRAAFGFSSDDITTLQPHQLHIKWKTDLDNVKYEIVHQIQKLGDKKTWAEKINLSKPIDVIFEKHRFYVDDGYHRYYAAKILKKPLNVNLEIKMNPISELAPNLSYDDFHRCVFNQIKKI